MIEIALTIAQGVIQSVIVDLINGRRSAARRSEIEAAAAALARERQSLTSEQVREIVSRTMDEVAEIIKRNPDLIIGRLGAVKLAPQVARKNTPELRDEILTDRLQRLSDIVNQRRASLGLDLGLGNPARQHDPAAMIEYEQVSDSQLHSDLWRSELDAMKERVHKRRSRPTDKRSSDE